MGSIRETEFVLCERAEHFAAQQDQHESPPRCTCRRALMHVPWSLPAVHTALLHMVSV